MLSVVASTYLWVEAENKNGHLAALDTFKIMIEPAKKDNKLKRAKNSNQWEECAKVTVRK